MDMSTFLGIAGILITILFGILPFILKDTNPSINNTNNSNNRNSFNNNSFNTNNTTIYYNRTVTNNNDPKSDKASPNDDDIWVFLILGVIAMSFVVAFYLRYQQLIITILTCICVTGVLLTTLLVVLNRKKFIPHKNRLLLIFSWIPLFVLILLIQHPLNIVPDLSKVTNSLLNPGTKGIFGKFMELMFNDNKDVLTFLIFQIVGILPLLATMLFNFITLFKQWKSTVTNKELKNHFISYMLFYILSFLMVSGLLVKLMTSFKA